MTPSDSTTLPSTRVSVVGVVVALVGVAVLVATVRRAGWGEIRAGLSAVGAWFIPVVILGGLRFLARARALTICAGQVGAGPLTTRRAFAATIAADAVGNLTPLGLLASEPTKVLLLRPSAPAGPAFTAVALDNMFYAGSVVLMLAAGAWLLMRQSALPPAVRSTAQAVLAAVVAGALVAAWAARQRPAVLSRAAQLAARLSGRVWRPSGLLHDIEARFYGVVNWPSRTLTAVISWKALFHVAAVAEGWLILSVLSGGRTTLAEAFILESTGRLVTVIFKMVPFRIGVDEASAAMVAGAIGVPIPDAVALALVRKLRILVWSAAGLGVLARARR